MNRQDRDRGDEMRLTERTRKLIPSRDNVRRIGMSDQLYVARMMLVERKILFQTRLDRTR